MPTIKLLKRAERELNNACNWYEEQQFDLSVRFINKLEKSFELISSNPDRFPKKYGTYLRFAPIKKFPYLIVYRFDEPANTIVVTSIFHTKRNLKSLNSNNELPAWATEEIIIEEYNPVWPLMASILTRELKSLYDFKDAKFEHIGSTAVPDLVAKPVIDLMFAVDNFNDIQLITAALLPEDWHLIPPELTSKDYQRTFVKVVKDKRAAHLHLFLKETDEPKRHIDFRNLLRQNSNLADDYVKLKTELAETFKNDREGYTSAKTEFITKALKMIN